ncbi:hypothetical protein NESM_000853400 [Novymonas esmeraldas]|uniref:Uncharacterized protein n=1 Tax=Novymonas esmeraldas TaxID=1808958 RepID=A0AAW0F121_9TRYP
MSKTDCHASAALHMRRMSLVLLLLLLLPFVSVGVLGDVSTYYQYTAVQQVDTRKFLRAFIAVNPLLENLSSDNFCDWPYVDCTLNGVDFYLDETSAAGVLPDVPAGVRGRNIILTSINIRYAEQNLIGTLPASWGVLSQVRFLSLYRNALTGTLPPEWSGMRGVSWMMLNDNHFRGTVPTSWGSLPFVTWVNLNGNMLTGSVPASWSRATRLRIVEMEGNALSGTLPAEWSSMDDLRAINMRHNNLTGTLPSAWASAPMLNTVSLIKNRFCGCVPTSWVARGSAYRVDVDEALTAANCSTANACR